MKKPTPDCLPSCRSESLADNFPDEARPDNISEAFWNEVGVVLHAENCPRLAQIRERGLQLKKEGRW